MNWFDEEESPEELGEFGLIERIARLTGSGNTHDSMGIGDDCAVIRNTSNGFATLITTDMLVEGRHFKRNWISAEDLGYTSLAVNISDISAMGGKPRYALLSIGLPGNTDPDWLNGFFGGIKGLCDTHGMKLIGGDTVKSNSVIVNFTVLGSIPEKNILLRSGAKPGDKLGLIGRVGDSGAGLRLLKQSSSPDLPLHRHLISAHNRPTIYVREAIFLAESGFVHSMIDVSDGIRSDAAHIAKQSGAKLTIHTDRLPVSDVLAEVCNAFSWSPEEIALTAGEDYALLFSFHSDREENLKRSFQNSFPDTPFSVIGSVSDGNAGVRFLKNGRNFDPGAHGFDQFKSD
ncbi:thiamine-phosphate kinase [Rhodohalobacter mucosus]|uniref:Thiamine-monophosphate kinase n=1 Tax=Rhodohalobacter mucosus TaxID=2079485 RepID=A0A316TQ22_9BACT|nr:thiamine-phosphate kinase [Rhodohalobacter mucosus]PWN06490.1 thiamine-phosphate kinase [Rhodohalobacter mucosus]